MELLQIFDRTAGTWSARHRLIAGYSESYVIDKTTDSGKDFRIKMYDCDEPNYNSNDWARILHVATADEAMTYDSNGIPTNSSHYLIKDLQKVYDKSNQIWTVDFTFKEPVERFIGVLGETETFTNQIQKIYDGVTYYKERYNHYTALRRWLMVTPANCDTYDANLTPSANNKSWYNRIKILDTDWLKTLDFSDCTYNELNLYNVLMDNFDSSTGRTPVAYFDINPATDLPYNLDRDEYILKFERQDGFDKTKLSYEALVEKNIGLTITQEDSNFATGLACNAENLSGKSNVNYPAQGLYAVPEVDTDNRDISEDYTTEGTNNWILKVPFPIKTVTKIYKVLLSGKIELPGTLTSDYDSNVIKYDHSAFLKEKQEYLAADEDTSGSRWIWYETGENIIHLRNMFFNQDDSCTIYYIEYEPLPNAKLIFGDNEYVQQINQTASQIDSDKFAKYANEYLGGMKKADVVIGKYYYQYSEFSDLIGSRVEKADGKLYMITQVAYKNIGVAGYNVFLQLNENHMRKNNAYTAPQAIRTNTAIATSNIKNRLSVIKQVVKVGAVEQTQSGFQFLVDKRIALSALRPNLIDSKYYPQIALFKGYSKLFTDSGLTTTSDFNIVKLANIAKLQSGNQVNLIATYFGNSAAGKYKELDIVVRTEDGQGYRYEFRDPKNQIPVIYTDPFGEVQKIDLLFSSVTADAFEEGNYPGDKDVYNDRKNALFLMAGLPNVSAEMQAELETNAGIEVENLQYQKDMLEKFNMNVTIELEADKDCIVCSGFLEYSRLLNLTDTHTVYFELYSTEQSENDGIDNRLGSYQVTSWGAIVGTAFILNSTYWAGVPTLQKDIIVNATKSIVIKANDKKMLIFNNLSDTIKENLLFGNSGRVEVYYA